MCTTLSIPPQTGALTPRACSGKCRGGAGCSESPPPIWVIAALGGSLTLFEKTTADLRPHPLAAQHTLVGLEMLAHAVREAIRKNLVQQFIIVGAPNDISWMQATLPEEATTRIVAEIPSVLNIQWFREAGLPALSRALRELLA